MPLSWNEIRTRAAVFAEEWADETQERAEAQTFWNEFFEVFGKRRRSIALYEAAVQKLGHVGTAKIDLFWPGVLLAEHKAAGKDLDSAFLQATDYILALPENDRPRYVIVSDFARIRLYDLEPEDPQAESHREFPLADLSKRAQFFAFIAGYGESKYKDEDPINVKAVQAIGKLHDAFTASGFTGHPLELLLVRLVFCLFADDTGIFEKDLLRDFLETRTAVDGSDLGGHLAFIFQTLNTPPEKRQKNIDEDINQFPYVDGHLFEETTVLPSFDGEMRKLLLDCAAFDWSAVSPAIFGSMFQSVMDEERRHEIGAHYTSEKNILKVIRGLFLDDLLAEFAEIAKLKTPKMKAERLKAFHDKLAALKFLDPACGCGNFLVVTYRELRALEIEVLKLMFPATFAVPDVGRLSRIDVDCMYGIELEEFPARVASLALWLTDHQMNVRLGNVFGVPFARLPLAKSPTIRQGNALQIDWESVVPKGELSYIFGNPPFIAKAERDDGQKADMESVFEELNGANELDYVSAWYAKGVEYIQGTDIGVAFVSTNSIAQGEQVGILWPHLLGKGAKINFAHRTFKWTNEARGKAAVHCIIIGFALNERPHKLIYEYASPDAEPLATEATHINPYLIDFADVFIEARRSPVCDVPKIVFGSMPNDGGRLIFNEEEKKDFLAKEPAAKKFIKKFITAKEYLHGVPRYCLWLKDVGPDEFRGLPEVMSRVEDVRALRTASSRKATRQLADTPYLFGEDRQPATDYVLVPRHSSESRKYVPMSFFSPENIAGDSCVIVPGASLYHFGVMESEMHMAWMRQVCGRIKSDFRYSNEIVYNNFPWPEKLEPELVQKVTAAAQAVLAARAAHPTATLADLYDPNTMPKDLLDAHRTLDRAVDRCYGQTGFVTESLRLKFIFARYQELTAWPVVGQGAESARAGDRPTVL